MERRLGGEGRMKEVDPTDDKFSKEIIDWWVKWVRIHNKKVISQEEAEKDLDHLQEFISCLKSLYTKK
jgi:hypothetical protein